MSEVPACPAMATPSSGRIFPPAPGLTPRIDRGLLLALVQANDTVRRAGARGSRAAMLGELGDIDLPDTAPADLRQLEVAAPLYLACELERAGLLRTAELIAGLFAGGAITQPLGPTTQLIASFWKGRRERLSAEERDQLFAQVFDAAEFYPLLQGLCDALAAQFDSPSRASDVRARVALRVAADALIDWLAPRLSGMASFAAQDIVDALSQATRFLRDRMLQTAFGVHDLWGLVRTVGSAQGASVGDIRQHVELGRQGAVVLAWLASAGPRDAAFEPGGPEGLRLIGAAEAWRAARAGLQRSAAPSGPLYA
jgi:hypothetical protein